MKVQQLFEKVIKPWNAKAMETEKAINFLNANCKSGLKSIALGKVLFRGFKDKLNEDFTFIDTSKAERTSRDTNNLYQIMMDASASLREYPSRSKSLICTGDFEEAGVYAGTRQPHIVIPFDGTVIAEANNNDIFNTSIETTLYDGDIEYIGKNIAQFLTAFGIKPDSGKQFTNIKAINQALSKFSPEILAAVWLDSPLSGAASPLHNGIDVIPLPAKVDMATSNMLTRIEKLINDTYKEYDRDEKYVIDFFRKANSKQYFTAIASEIMTPKNLKLNKFVDNEYMVSRSHEFWFEGKCVVISADMFRSILVEMTKRKMKVDKYLWYLLND